MLLKRKEASDDLLLNLARLGIENLNKKYRIDNGTLFYLFHRPRQRNPKEKTWMGHERKRGKLMEFNSLLRGKENNCFSHIEGDRSILPSFKYVITLDADTQLSPDTAHKLIGTMAHPLNQAELDVKRNVVVGGYGILQPRVSSNLVSSQCSPSHACLQATRVLIFTHKLYPMSIRMCFTKVLIWAKVFMM